MFHCLDVAAVGEALLCRHRGLRAAFANLMRLPQENVGRLLCFLLSLHDIGKFAKKFQAKEPRLFPKCFDDDPASLPSHYDHGAGGLRLFSARPDAFKLPSGVPEKVWRPLISAVTGHHGAPPDPGDPVTLHSLRSDFGKPGIKAAHAFIERVHELFSELPSPSSLDARLAKRASHAVAGFAVLADWIGSNQDWFPYCRPDQDLDTYWRLARQRAMHAVEESGVLPAVPGRRLDYRHLFDAHAPSPMQDWARTVELSAGPALFLIEDETGSGKTEVALMLSARLMESGRADGLYVALPTMATANAMYDRLAEAHRHLFATGAKPSVSLAHGARNMHPGFRLASLPAGRDEHPYSRIDNQASETTASCACAEWIADDRRRAFLADVGTGTIDQALLSILPIRHQSLHLLGLMRRVLVLDEVHAYDAYMQREMEALLQFQAGLGGCAILLSATLPRIFRQRLVAAFAKGLEGVAADADASMDYPLATVCSTDTRYSQKVAGQAGRARRLPVRFLRFFDEALGEVERAASDGKAALYIRNTVDDALDAHRELAGRGLKPLLFHARFALTDRLAIEKQVLDTFGKDSTSESRAGRILIATQVVEQSLDLDFDVLVSDLAPIDLLIQRSGRLWRHDRLERQGDPELVVVGPEATCDPGEDWYDGQAFRRAKHVYKDHARLWLTMRALQESECIDTPHGLRSLIEAVYGDDVKNRIPKALRKVFYKSEGESGANRGIATSNVLNFSKGYVHDGGAWDSDMRTPTRIEDVSRVTLRLGRVRDGRIEPYAREQAPGELWRAWRLSELSVPSCRISDDVVPDRYAEAARAAKADWTRFDTDKILVVPEESVEAGETGVEVAYDPCIGLSFGQDIAK